MADDLTDFLARYERDDNEWWRLGSGEHLNLFDAAIERAEKAEAEVERLRAIITSLDCATAERDAAIRRRDQAENRAGIYRQQVADLKAHRDVLIDEVKTLQGDLEAFGEARKAWVQFRRERDALKAAIERVRAVAVEILGKFHEQVIFGEYSRRTGWIPEKQIAAWRGAIDQPAGPDAPTTARCPSCDHLTSGHQQDGCWYAVTTGTVGCDLVCPCTVPAEPTEQDNKPDWRERARIRVGDRVAARLEELMAANPMSADEFDEAMRRNKAEAEAYLNQQSREAFGDQPTDQTRGDE